MTMHEQWVGITFFQFSLLSELRDKGAIDSDTQKKDKRQNNLSKLLFHTLVLPFFPLPAAQVLFPAFISISALERHNAQHL